MRQDLIPTCTRFKISFVNAPWMEPGWLGAFPSTMDVNSCFNKITFLVFSPKPTPNSSDLGVCPTLCQKTSRLGSIRVVYLLSSPVCCRNWLFSTTASIQAHTEGEGVRGFLVPCGVHTLIWTLSNPLSLPETAFISNPKVQLLWFITLWSE